MWVWSARELELNTDALGHPVKLLILNPAQDWGSVLPSKIRLAVAQEGGEKNTAFASRSHPRLPGGLVIRLNNVVDRTKSYARFVRTEQPDDLSIAFHIRKHREKGRNLVGRHW